MTLHRTGPSFSVEFIAELPNHGPIYYTAAPLQPDIIPAGTQSAQGGGRYLEEWSTKEGGPVEVEARLLCRSRFT